MSKLVCEFTATVAGRTYSNLSDRFPRPISFEVEHRDQEVSRCKVVVWDGRLDQLFKEYNAIPNPHISEPSMELWAGWEGETKVKMFQGILRRKALSHQAGSTVLELVGLHDAFKLRKVARGRSHKELSVKQLLIKLGAEHGITVRFDASTAKEPVLSQPMSWYPQLTEANWQLMWRYIRDLGLIANTINDRILVIKTDKSIGSAHTFRYGGDDVISLNVEQENKKSQKSSKRSVHHHETKPSQFSIPKEVLGADGAWHRQPVPPALAKDSKGHKRTLAKASARGKARRKNKQGDKLQVEVRAVFSMRNEERIIMSGYGPQIDGEWDTERVCTRGGGGPATTSIEAIREAR